MTEIFFNNENISLLLLHRSPSHNHEQLYLFYSDFNSLLSNINNNRLLCSNSRLLCSVIVGDFNCRCSKWYSPDKNNTAGLEIEASTTTAG